MKTTEVSKNIFHNEEWMANIDVMEFGKKEIDIIHSKMKWKNQKFQLELKDTHKRYIDGDIIKHIVEISAIKNDTIVMRDELFDSSIVPYLNGIERGISLIGE